MQLSLSFTALLAGVLIALSAQDAVAVPVAKRNAGMVTLPIKRVQQRSADVHPRVYLQQHVNRANRRLARMSGREVPSDLELRAALDKRILANEADIELAKRFNRHGVHPKSGRSEEDATPSKRYNRFTPHQFKGLGSIANGVKDALTGKKHHGQGTGAAAGGSGAAAGGSGAAASDSGAAAAGSGAAAGGDGASDATAVNTAEVPIPTDVTVSDTPTTSDSSALDIEGTDIGYLATVQLGTPPQDFLILMDSGSADFWVGAENCQSQDTSQTGCGNHNFLGTDSSSSFVESSSTFSVTYGTGNVAGNLVTDNVVLAGLSLPAHSFGVATSESVDFSSDDTPFDGLMGLAQSTLSEQGVLTPVESLAQAGLITDAITSYKIPRLADNLADGEITFGALDPSKFNSASLVTVSNVNTQGFWEVSLDAVSVNGGDAGLSGRTAILDTGTTLMILPTADAAAVHALIPGSSQDAQGDFLVPCDTTASVALTVGGGVFAIDPRDIVTSTVSGNTCLSGIQAGNIGGATEWLVGDVFLKNVYYSTVVGANQISLATLT